MGFAMKNLEYLANKGYVKPDSAILDIGSQCLYHASPEAIRAFVDKYGDVKDEEAFEKEAKRISYFSWPRPGERTSYLSELLDLTPRIGYTSFDVCPALKTEILDLNREGLPVKYRDHFDVVLNFGTTEHIINQMNTFRVMHDALKAGGIFFHQVPRSGWTDHGYFCYHNGFFEDIAKANDYEIVDLWYTLAGQASLAGTDIRDVQTPEIPQSQVCEPALLTIPSFNINVIMRKRFAQPFRVVLELATSHSALSGDVENSYAVDTPAPPRIKTEIKTVLVPSSGGAAAIPGWELARELGRRIKRRLGIKNKSETTANDQNQNSAPKPSEASASMETLPPAVLAKLTTEIVAPAAASFDAMACVEKGRGLLEALDIPKAMGHFNRALAVVHQFPYALIELNKISAMYNTAGSVAWAQGSKDAALNFTVAAIEANPKNSLARELMAKIDQSSPRPDITKNCYVFYDGARADSVHREAIRRCLEYTAISGVIGDVLEFGVLAGWSARIFAETMRDLMVMGNLYLFDSFAGLPDYSSPVDQISFEIAGRNIWSDKMKFQDDFVAQLGGSVERHIQNSLAYVIRKERIKTFPGFYSETLKNPLKIKAALVHIDCDLYQSTVEVLEGLLKHDVFQDGCVLMFDDWNCNKANPNFGERRAFREFLEKQKKYTASEFFTYGFNGAAFILHEAKP